MGRGFGIERAFQPVTKVFTGGRIRVRHPSRRHLAGRYFAKDSFKQVAFIGDGRKVHSLEGYSRRFQLVVVAADAVALDESLVRSDGRLRCWSLTLRIPEGRHDSDA